MNFKEQYKHPKWQKKRLEILERDKYTCQSCGADDRQLHVHHRFYIKDRKVWEYDNDVFHALCEDCHKNKHSEKPLGLISQHLIKNNINSEDVEFIMTNIDKDAATSIAYIISIGYVSEINKIADLCFRLKSGLMEATNE